MNIKINDALQVHLTNDVQIQIDEEQPKQSLPRTPERSIMNGSQTTHTLN